MKISMRAAVLAACLGFGFSAAQAVPLVAEFTFNNTLSSTVGTSTLSVTDPSGTSGFVADTVFGNARTVWAFNGANSPPTAQAGLTLNTTGLLSSNGAWSAEVDFEFFNRTNAWRRIIDVQNRTSDNGFYVDPSNHLDVFPVAGTTSTFQTGVYTKVFIAVGGNQVSVWLGNQNQFTFSTPIMNIDANNLINLFLDNTQAGGQGEWSAGRIAYFSLYNGTLTDADVAVLSGRSLPTGNAPAPGALALLGLGLAGLASRRRKAA